MPAPRAGCRISSAARKANDGSGPGRNPPTRIRVSDIPRFQSSETRNENKMRPGPDVFSDDDNSRLGLSIPGPRGRHSDL
jgi:hypothetical protein